MPGTEIAPKVEISVAMAYGRRLLDVVERLGLPRAALLRHARIDAAEWSAPQGRLPFSALVALFRTALALTGRRDLGLEFGRDARPDTFDVLGYALMSCRDLEEAIGLVPLYRRIVFDSGYSETHFGREGGHVKLAWVVLPEAARAGLPYCDLLAESLLASWAGFGRWITRSELPLREVRFLHGAPEDTLPFDTFFDCPVRFAAGENAMLFDGDLLSRPLVQADAALNLAMRDEARMVIARLQGGHDIVSQVRQALVPLMPKCETTLKHVAASLGMTPRTMQRRLVQAGASFHGLLDASRRELAQVYLRDSSLSALDVALLLGYAEQSSFTRAFRNWFATSPSAWRKGW